MPEQAITTVEQRPDLVVVRIELERIDESNLEGVRAGVAAAGSASPLLPVAVDCSKVSFMPSMTMAALIQLAQLFRSRKQRLAFVNLQPLVHESLVAMRLDRVLEIHHDLSALTSRAN